MPNFIFYTMEGQTQDDAGKDINNIQLLDYQKAESVHDAMEQFNNEIDLSEYTFDGVYVQEIVGILTTDAIVMYLKEENDG